MPSIRSSIILLAATLLLASCTDDTVGPTVGSGKQLEATITTAAGGQNITFPLDDFTISPATYDVADKEGTISSTLTGTPLRTVRLSFTYDIDKGPFPKTLIDPDISIIYVEISGTDTATYNCPIGKAKCTMTLTASNGEIVDGTFGATLARMTDTTKTVTITNGKFSAKLKRQ